MNKLFLSCLLFLSLIISCSDEIMLEENGFDNGVNNSYTRPLEQALVQAQNLMDEIEGHTKSAVRKYPRVEYITNKTTRGGLQDTLLYLVNYYDNQGFALLGATEGSYDIYAISPTGHLEMNDTIECSSLSAFVNAALAHASENKSQSVVIGWKNWMTKIDAKVDPMLHPFVSSWNQRSPYNIMCPTIDGQKCLVGCVALAYTQLISYYKYPQKYTMKEGFEADFMWNDMLENWDTGSAAIALHNIGVKFDMKYGLRESGADSSDMIPVSKSLGYKSIAFKGIRLSDNLRRIIDFMEGKSETEAAPPYG